MEINFMKGPTCDHTHSYIFIVPNYCNINIYALAVKVNYQIESNVNSRDKFQRMEILINLP